MIHADTAPVFQVSPDQVSYLLTRSAVDANAASGCRECPLGRDHLAGWGRLDVTAAIAQATAGRIPPADRLEANDDAGAQARTLFGPRGGRVEATIDFWDDQSDVYRIRLFPGQRLFVSMSHGAGVQLLLPIEPLLESRESHETARPACWPVLVLTPSLPASP